MRRQLNEVPQIFSTTDYDMFREVLGNRAIYAPALRRLRQSVEKKNSLPYTPIKVNSDMEVIDGQHRLTVARELGLPIYYVIENDANIDTVRRVNTNLRPWTIFDYLESYIAQGKTEYKKLYDFINEYSLSISVGIFLLSGAINSTKVHRDFKEGIFTVVEYEKAERTASFLNEIRRFSPDRVWMDRHLTQAVYRLDGKLDQRAFLTSLEINNLRVTRRPTTAAYLFELDDILNFGKKDSERITLSID